MRIIVKFIYSMHFKFGRIIMMLVTGRSSKIWAIALYSLTYDAQNKKNKAADIKKNLLQIK